MPERPFATYLKSCSRSWVCHREMFAAVFLFLLALLVFLPALRCEFINLDDPSTVFELREAARDLSWESVRWAFSNTVVSHWAPLTSLSHMLDCQAYGLQPWGHHLTNVLLHSLSTMLLFLVLNQMTAQFWRSGIISAVWAIHPLRVESVVWVTERKDVLSGFFFMLTLLAYGRYVRHQSPARYSLIIVPFALGLMSKSMLVTLPFVLLLLDFWPLNRVVSWAGCRTSFREKLPLLALSAAFSVVQIVAVKGFVESVPLKIRLGNAAVATVTYLENTFWPENLAVFYPHPGGWPVERVLFSVVLLLGVSFAASCLSTRHPSALFGWLWFLGMLIPVIGIIQIGGISRADRYTYLPSVGILVALVWIAAQIRLPQRLGFYPRMVASMVVVALLVTKTQQNIAYWKNTETLFRRALAVTTDNWVADSILAGILADDAVRWPEAMFHCQRALRLNPTSESAYNSLGMCLSQHQNRFHDAIAAYNMALKLKPDYPEAHNNLGYVLFRYMDQPHEAILHYQIALRIRPAFAEAHNNLGLALMSEPSQLPEAINHLERAIQLMPELAEAHYNLGTALLENSAHPVEAITHLKMALQIQPQYSGAANNLGLAFLKTGRISEGILEFEAALRINPQYSGAHYNLGLALSKIAGRRAEAISHLETACRIDPKFTAAKEALRRIGGGAR